MPTPLDHNPQMASETFGKPFSHLSDGGSLLGWDCVVAPINSFTRQRDPDHFDHPQVGDVPKLPGRGDAAYEMAPSLFDVIRRALQGKQVSVENIDLYLTKHGNLQRYDRAFRKLWVFCTSSGGDPFTMSVEEVASWLLRFSEFSPMKPGMRTQV